MQSITKIGVRLSAGIACAALFLPLVQAQPASAQTVKVGMILTYSGRDAALGEQIDRAVNLFVKMHEKELPPGVKVELIKRDDTGVNPDLAKRLAQELILRDQVQILTGGQWTPNAMAVAGLDAVANQLSAWAVGIEARLEECLHSGQRLRSGP
jgi:branched-chain amino acid transport system substrate-binding protein